MNQSASDILLIRPAGFSFNEQTAASNAFQHKIAQVKHERMEQEAFEEFDLFTAKLSAFGINVKVIEDTAEPKKPDAIFPNNWISFHEDGTVVLYPMCAPNRRPERRLDIIDEIKKTFTVSKIIDLSFYEKENRFLEGTGSIIFDHQNKIAYACLSPRTDQLLFVELCEKLTYSPVYFKAQDENGIEIYHTNVMMCVAEDFSVICLEAITGDAEKEMVIDSLSSTGHKIIDISLQQMRQFAGNMLSLKNKRNEKFLAMSQSAFDSLNATQIETINKYCKMIPLDIKTIETIGGGSARCMMAEIFNPLLVQEAG